MPNGDQTIPDWYPDLSGFTAEERRQQAIIQERLARSRGRRIRVLVPVSVARLRDRQLDRRTLDRLVRYFNGLPDDKRPDALAQFFGFVPDGTDLLAILETLLETAIADPAAPLPSIAELWAQAVEEAATHIGYDITPEEVFELAIQQDVERLRDAALRRRRVRGQEAAKLPRKTFGELAAERREKRGLKPANLNIPTRTGKKGKK